MPDLGLRDEDLKWIRETLHLFPSVEQGIVFGSRAKGTHKPGSDVDLALKGASLTFEETHRISYLLNEETLMPYRFDVLQYSEIQSEELIEHIDRVGAELYSSSKDSPFAES